VPTEPSLANVAAIRGAGLRVTETRREVYAALVALPHARADDVFGRVQGALPGTSLQSVYNALGDFVEAGLARRIEPDGQPGLFELRVADNHHHIVCSSCGRVEDVDCVQGQAPCLHPEPAQTHGFAVHSAEVTFWGLCPGCAASA
jgi:Fe2+ or Zn2+ uptake regulation protein